MKKIALTSLLAVFAISGANATNYFVGGSAALSFDDSHKNIVSVAPEFGFHYNDKWDLGVNADLAYDRDYQANKKGEVKDRYSYGADVFARYNVAEFGAVKLLLKGSVGADFMTFDGETSTALNASVIPMVTYNISKDFTLYANLNFLGVNAGYQFKNDAMGIKEGWKVGAFADSANVANTGDFQIGFFYNF